MGLAEGDPEPQASGRRQSETVFEGPDLGVECPPLPGQRVEADLSLRALDEPSLAAGWSFLTSEPTMGSDQNASHDAFVTVSQRRRGSGGGSGWRIGETTPRPARDLRLSTRRPGGFLFAGIRNSPDPEKNAPRGAPAGELPPAACGCLGGGWSSRASSSSAPSPLAGSAEAREEQLDLRLEFPDGAQDAFVVRVEV